MCNHVDCECCEAHNKEYEEDMKAMNEYLESLDGSDEVSEAEIHAALIFDVRDKIDCFSQEEKEQLKSIVDGKLGATEKDRAYIEAKELGEKIEKLHKFLVGYNSDGVRHIVDKKLTDAAVYLLQEQEKAMMTYYNCLVARLSIWGVEAPKE